MVSADNKPRKRKDEKKNLCSAWEGFDADNGQNDDNAFYGCQRAKQQVKRKCRYLEEKNIVVSHDLLSEALSSRAERSDVAEKISPGCKASQDNTLSTKSPMAFPAEANSLSQSPSDTDCFPTNNNTLTNLIHKPNIIYGLRSVKTSSLELKRTLPLIKWASATTCVQMAEKPVTWRCKGFVTVNREARRVELPQLWKRASGKKLEWCHGSRAKLAHLQTQSLNNGPPVTRTRPVIRKAGLTMGHGGVQVQESHAEQNFVWKTETKCTGLPNDRDSAPPVPTYKKGLYNFWSTTQAEATLGQQDGGQIHRKQGTISMSQLSDMLCQAGCQGDRETPTMPHDVTLFHMLEVLQSKPVNFPQVRGQRCLKAL